MLEIAPGHHTPDSFRGNPKPLSLSSAFTTPPNPPKREINDAHTHGFIAITSSEPECVAPRKHDEMLLHYRILRNVKLCEDGCGAAGGRPIHACFVSGPPQFF